ncbi:MAG: primosomal protein N' (replication factor Y) - superfamily II helicase [Pseudomonadota bacterium]
MPRQSPAPGGDRFPCRQCGALQVFKPGSTALECTYCGHRTPIEVHDGLIIEYDFDEALETLADAPPAGARPSTQCENCAAEFDFDEHVHAGECPFCGTQIVAGTGTHRHIKPESLLPFSVDESAALGAYRRWIKRLWFAPNAIKNYARQTERLTGVYVPYWTYDSQTHTRYRGQRGDNYTVRESYTAIENGRSVRRTRTVTKIRWRSVSGQVARFFDDVLVGASRSLPRKITDRLQPWDLDHLVGYDEKFLSGFRSEVYQVDLDEGFDQAVNIMDRVIRSDIARDIGGDHQRIQQVQTRHSDTTFKHLLLPVWSAGFRFRKKTYRFVVNGRTGKVAGERPYSVVKIALAVVLGGIAAAAAFYVAIETGLLDELLRNVA